MTPDSFLMFNEHFGNPHRLYAALAIALFVVLVIAWMMIAMKAFKERESDAHIVGVVLRGLLLMLIFTAVFYQNF